MNPSPTALQTQLDLKRKGVDVDFFDLTIREIVRMVEEGELITQPEYQRNFRWKEATQSALIESLLLGLPIPAVFVASNKNATWEVVDGLQRIGTVVRYMGNQHSRSAYKPATPLALSELSELTEFEGLTFSDLPRPIQFVFEKRFIRIQVLKDNEDTDVRYKLFERLNSGAIALTPQEIRACVFRSNFAHAVSALALNEDFLSLVKLKKADQENGTAEEQVVKFFAYLDRAHVFDGKVKRFLNDYMQSREESDDVEIRKDVELFQEVVAQLSGILAGPLLRSNVSVTPLNHFEAVLVAAGRIIRNGGHLKSPKQGWLDDAALVGFSTKGTNTKKALLGRVDRAEDLLLGRN